MVYLKLFRWPNLLVVILTQYLVRYAIVLPLLRAHNIEPALSHLVFGMLVMSTVFISAAGYAINDYFDLRTDRINKPGKVILGRIIPRRSAIFYHTFFNITGFLLGAFVALMVGNWQLAFIFLVVPTLLWLYSVRYKKKFFIGNFLVAVLSAFVVAVVWVFEYQAISGLLSSQHPVMATINNFIRMYAFFAFLTTLSREIVKDVEDMKGDIKTACKTIPIVAGVKKAKWIVILLNVITIVLVAYVQAWLINREYYVVFVYFLVAVQLPFLWIIHKILYAEHNKDFQYISRWSKYVMVSGVLSMLLFYQLLM